MTDYDVNIVCYRISIWLFVTIKNAIKRFQSTNNLMPHKANGPSKI